MRKPSSKHKWIKIVAAALSLSLLAAAVPVALGGAAGPLRQGWETASRPFSRLFSPVRDKMDQVSGYLEDREALAEENHLLKERVASLEGNAVAGELARQENERLRALLDWPAARQNLTLEPAWVIRRSPDRWQRSLTLDKGSADGVDVGQLVVEEHGALVGRVTEIGEEFSQVSLITDPAFALSGLGTNSGVLATVQGSLSRMADGVTGFSGLTEGDSIVFGEGVVTFAAEGTYPSGIVMGRLVRLEEDPGGLTRTAVLAPTADLEHLREVFVITDFWEDG